jgi:trehalose 6-phosphate phosphatase
MTDRTRIANWVWAWLTTGGSLLVQADYDGALAPVVDDPAVALLPQEVRSDLGTLARSPQSRLALFSGHDIADLRERVSVSGAIYAGCHGLEIEGPTIAFRHGEAEILSHLVLDSVHGELARLALSIPGMRVVSKGLKVVVHCGHVTCADRARIHDVLAREVRRHRGRLRLAGGTEAIEILPWVDWSRGMSARWIQDQVRPTLRPPLLTLYLGDVGSDDVVEALAGRAVAIRVGRTAAARPDPPGDAAPVEPLLSALAAVVRLHRRQPRTLVTREGQR